MTDKPAKDIRQLFIEGTAIDNAIRKAVRDAVLRHKRLGQPIVIDRDGEVVWVPADEIEVDDEPS